MNVHIVCTGVTGPDNRILHRLSRLLTAGTGWSLGEKPNIYADLNYFFTYLEMPANWEGKSAAWFTHRDKSLPGKADLWEKAAKTVDLRLTSAEMYIEPLSKYGLTAYVVPPLDKDKFTIANKKTKNAKPIVGVSGYVYRGGRKGEALVKRLLLDKFNSKISLIAAGRGWPMRMRQWEWDKLQEFYQSLDVYLLPSSVEGVGYGVLESLSCGVKVVVPRGVGVMDELPDIPGIERYNVDDFGGMLRALQKAIETKADPEQLRSTTDKFTLDSWINGHLDAMSKLIGGEERESYTLPVSFPDWRGNSGTYIVAYGEPSRNCAKRCIVSIKKHMPDLPVCLISDVPLGDEDLFIERSDRDIGGRGAKLAIYDLAPKGWEYVIYLDADTELVGTINGLLEPLVDGWDVCWTHNPPRDGLLSDAKRPDNNIELTDTIKLMGTDNFLQKNGGVFSFRRSRLMQKFFKTWNEEWERHGARDQLALLRAFHRVPLRIWLLSREFNATERYGELGKYNAIRHWPMEARRWTGIIDGRLDSRQAWDRVREWEAVKR